MLSTNGFEDYGKFFTTTTYLRTALRGLTWYDGKVGTKIGALEGVPSKVVSGDSWPFLSLLMPDSRRLLLRFLIAIWTIRITS